MTGPPSLTVDLLSPVPAYEQIRQQVGAHVSAGSLVDGDRLPTVRALAAQLGLASNTVARAYRELEADGLVTSRRRVGTVVRRRPPAAPPDGDVERLHQRAASLAEAALRTDLGDEAVLTVVRGALLRARAQDPGPGGAAPRSGEDEGQLGDHGRGVGVR